MFLDGLSKHLKTKLKFGLEKPQPKKTKQGSLDNSNALLNFPISIRHGWLYAWEPFNYTHGGHSTMTKRTWRTYQTEKGSQYRDYNYREWCTDPNPHQLYIVQPKKHEKKYELWRKCRNGKGDRYPNKNYRCVNTFDSLPAARAAYLLYNSTLGDTYNPDWC
jgi:hypothetical protein